MTELSSNNMDLVYEGEVFDILMTVDPDTGQQLEFVRSADVVRVFPVDNEGKLHVINEVRPGLQGQTFLRVVSGGIDDSETAVGAAMRELGEEAGLLAAEAHVFHVSLPSLKLLYRIHHVVTDVVGHVSPHPDPGERVESFAMTLEDAEQAVWEGRFAEDITAFGVLTLLRWLRQRPLSPDPSR